jgi:peptidyl-prolyl cis-trans isomerase D
VTLEQVRPALEAQIRAEAAAEQVSAVIQRYEDAHAGGASLVESARAVNVPTLSIAPVAESGRDERGQPVQLEPALLKAAFEQPEGGETDIIDLGQGRYASARVDRVIAPAMPRLADVRNELTQIWRLREAQRLIQQRAEAVATQARTPAGLEAAARQANAPFTRFPNLQRNAETPQAPPQVVAAAFNARRGEIFTAPDPQQGVIVGRVDSVRHPPAAQSAAGLQARRQPLSLDLVNQLGASARAAARRLTEARTNPDRARAALGVAEEEPAERPR